MPERVVRHLVDSRRLEREWLLGVFAEVEKLENSGPDARTKFRLVYLSFRVPSNITKSAFVAATLRLGWGMFDRDPNHSMWDGDLEKEAQVANFQGYDVIVFRGSQMGDAEKIAAHSRAPVINAGEGFDGIPLLHFPQHPSQGITDASTIHRQFGGLDGLRVTLTGDIRHNPMVNSLLCTLANFKTEIFLTSRVSNLHGDVGNFLMDKKVCVTRVDTLREILPITDVLYIAHSRHTERADLLPGAYIDSVAAEDLALLPGYAVVMHDMRKGVLPEADGAHTNPKLIYKKQIENGVYSSMAMLKGVIEG